MKDEEIVIVDKQFGIIVGGVASVLTATDYKEPQLVFYTIPTDQESDGVNTTIKSAH